MRALPITRHGPPEVLQVQERPDPTPGQGQILIGMLEPYTSREQLGLSCGILGNGFQPGRGGVTVKFGLKEATAVVVASTDKIMVTTPGGDPNTTVDVTVIFDDGKAFKVANGFHYMAQVQNRGTLDKAFNQLGKDNKEAPKKP